LPVSDHGGLGLILDQIMWDLWWPKWPSARFFSKYCSFLLSVSVHQWCTLIFHSSTNDAIQSQQLTALNETSLLLSL